MKRRRTLWVMGKHTGTGNEWELQGVFKSELQAVENVKFDSEFIGPVPLGVRLPDERITWPGCYYPLLETPAQAAARLKYQVLLKDQVL